MHHLKGFGHDIVWFLCGWGNGCSPFAKCGEWSSDIVMPQTQICVSQKQIVGVLTARKNLWQYAGKAGLIFASVNTLPSGLSLSTMCQYATAKRIVG